MCASAWRSGCSRARDCRPSAPSSAGSPRSARCRPRPTADQARTIRIPVHMVETINRLMREQRRLVQELGRDPTSEELALEMEFLEPADAMAVLRAQAEEELMDPMLDRKLRRARP